MPLPLIAVVGGGAAVAAVAVSKGTAPSQTKEATLAQAVTVKPTLGNGSLPGQTTGQLVNLGAAYAAKRNSITASSGAAPIQNTTEEKWGLDAPSSYSSPTLDAALQEKLDTIEGYGRAAFENLDQDAKKAGADALNEALELDPPLDGTESWEEISKVAGGATGAAVGSIFGPAGTALGATVGAYLGVKLEELMSKHVDEIKDWFKSRWTNIEEWVKGSASDAYDAVADFFGDIF